MLAFALSLIVVPLWVTPMTIAIIRRRRLGRHREVRSLVIGGALMILGVVLLLTATA